MEAVSSLLLGIIILETLEENEEENNVRVKTRREEKKRVFIQTLSKSFVSKIPKHIERWCEWAMTFKFILSEIDQDITPMELTKGGLK